MNKHSGQNNYKGTNYQAWTAMAMLLQHVNSSDFRQIGFEGDNLEDFYLVFESGRKIICEAKAYNVGFSLIKKILNNIIKHNQFSSQDEILIICEEADKRLKNLVEHSSYYDQQTLKKISKENSFTDKQVKLLSKVRFWEISQKQAENIAEKIFASIFRLWIPKHKISGVVRDLLEKEVLQGSQSGTILNRDEFLNKLDDRKRLIFDDEGYEKEKTEKEKELTGLVQELKNPSSLQWKNNRLTILSDNPDEHYWLLTLLENESNLDLRSWDKLWQMSIQGTFVMEVFKIFKKNMSSTLNQDYFIEQASNIIDFNSNFFREDFIRTDIVDICKKILETTRKHDNAIFKLIDKLFEPSISKYFYTKHREDNRHEWEEISKLLLELYNRTELLGLRDRIISYIFEKFNLAEDGGNYWHYTPPLIFEIVRLNFENNPQSGVLKLTIILSKQFNDYYKRFGKKLKFEGWEHMGSGIGQAGSEFSIQDRRFIVAILMPLLHKMRKENKELTWKFVLKHCITSKKENISEDNPDFLNRACLPILFEEYKNGKYVKKAFEILSDFVRMRKGIPWKADLIFQELRGDYSKKQKWDLVKVGLDEYKNLPVNVFVEQIVFDLVSKSHPQASRVVSNWVENPEYDSYRMTGAYGTFASNLMNILDNKETFIRGVEIFKSYIKSAKFTDKENDWDTWDVAKALSKIITINPEIGIGILNDASSSKKLSQNQQTLICSSINDLSKEDKKLLNTVYQDFVSPFLLALDNDISKIEGKITNRYSREQIVQFAEKLALSGLLDEAFFIVKIFINDSDPILGNYPDDPKGDFNEHEKVKSGDDSLTIRTVRGWCAWVLQKLFIPRDFARVDKTREIIEKSLPLLENLATDRNYYVRVQVAVPLIELAKNRNTILPEKVKERFVSPEIAQKIEDLAFLMLRDPINHKLPAVMKHLAMVFTYLRSINQEKAYEVLQIFLKDEYPNKDKQRGRESHLADVLGEAASLFMFFAEFRTRSFKDWPKDWGDLGEFDDKPFKDFLIYLTKSKKIEIRQIFIWQFERLPNEIKNTLENRRTITLDEAVKLSVSYLDLATGDYNHNVFENIYHFIEDYIDDYFDVCFDLWKKCIDTEGQFFKDNYSKNKLLDMYWWPFFYNGKVLLAIAKQQNNKEFLKWFKKLADYPIELLIANDLDSAVEYLITIKTNRKIVEKLFSRLIERNSKYYEFKQRWKQNIKKNKV